MFLPPPLWSEGPTLCSMMFLPAPRKREGQRTLAAACTGDNDRQLFIEDIPSDWYFLVDSGAQRSIVPPSSADTLGQERGPRLDVANGTPIRTIGTRFMSVCINGREFSWDFVVASVSVPILGTDFMCAYRLLVDVSNRCLIELCVLVLAHVLWGRQGRFWQTCLQQETCTSVSLSFLPSLSPRFLPRWPNMG